MEKFRNLTYLESELEEHYNEEQEKFAVRNRRACVRRKIKGLGGGKKRKGEMYEQTIMKIEDVDAPT